MLKRIKYILDELSDRSLMDFVPATFHQVGRLLTEQIEPHCFMVAVSPMDKQGLLD